MKKVEFVRIKSEISGYGLGKGTKYCFEGVEETISERIKDGWEYGGYVPLITRGTGEIDTISLIFSRDE